MTIDLDEFERLEREWLEAAHTNGRFDVEFLRRKYELALRNAAAPMIQELRELRQDVKTFQFDATLYRNRLADALAQADALRAELKEIKDDKSWNDGVIFDLRAEVEGLKAANTKAVAHATEEEALKWEAITREGERQSVIDSLRAQLATAREAIRATVDLLESSRKANSKGSPEYDALFIRREVGGVLEDALKKTTKGGGV